MKALVCRASAVIVCLILIFTYFTTAFAAENETKFVSEPGSVLVGVVTKGVGKVTGGGIFQKGDTVTLTAETDGTHDFKAWFDSEGEILSAELTLTFTAEENCFITAEFDGPTPEEKEANKDDAVNEHEVARQAVWIVSIVAVAAVVVFLVIIVEKKRSK